MDAKYMLVKNDVKEYFLKILGLNFRQNVSKCFEKYIDPKSAKFVWRSSKCPQICKKRLKSAEKVQI